MDGPLNMIPLNKDSCSECGRGLHPVFPDRPKMRQFEGSLEVFIEGGYGMYFDYSHQIPEFVLCKGCCDILMAAFPNIARALSKYEMDEFTDDISKDPTEP